MVKKRREIKGIITQFSRRLGELRDERIPTVSIHDLIELKLRAGRKQDLADVEHLRMVLER